MQQDTRRKPRRTGTKVKLIRAAERLIAQNGLGAVSVRDITRAAGARNESALHYHFGNKDALIRAVFEDRIRSIDAKRLALLADFDQHHHPDAIAALMHVAIAPLMQSCQEEGGRLYAAFLMQVTADPRFDVDTFIGDVAPDSVREVARRLRPLLVGLPRATRITRLRRLPSLIIAIVADHARDMASGTAPSTDRAISEASISLAGYVSGAPKP